MIGALILLTLLMFFRPLRLLTGSLLCSTAAMFIDLKDPTVAAWCFIIVQGLFWWGVAMDRRARRRRREEEIAAGIRAALTERKEAQ